MIKREQLTPRPNGNRPCLTAVAKRNSTVCVGLRAVGCNGKINYMMIRAYQQNDWDSVTDIFSRAKPDEFKGSVQIDDIIPLEKDEDILKSFHQSVIFVAAQDNRLIGFTGYNKNLITFLFTDPAYYRQRVATGLLEYILPLIGNKAWLLVLKTNLPALKLYENVGFHVVEAFSGKYNRRIEVEILRLAIEPAQESWK
jgi:ribosomal protein S18 acetylase RimI-like enzyme